MRQTVRGPWSTIHGPSSRSCKLDATPRGEGAAVQGAAGGVALTYAKSPSWKREPNPTQANPTHLLKHHFPLYYLFA